MEKEKYLYCQSCGELLSKEPLEKIVKEGQDKVIITCPKCNIQYEVSDVEYEYDL